MRASLVGALIPHKSTDGAYWDFAGQGDPGAYTVAMNNRQATAPSNNVSSAPTVVIAATKIHNAGKFYFEFLLVSGADPGVDTFGFNFGILPRGGSLVPGGANPPEGAVCYTSFGRVYDGIDGTFTYPNKILDGDVVGWCVNFDLGLAWVFINGVQIGAGDPVFGTGGTVGVRPAGGIFYVPFTQHQDGDGGNQDVRLRLQTAEFTYPPPSGFSAWLSG